MTRVTRAALAILFATSAISPALAQTKYLRPSDMTPFKPSGGSISSVMIVNQQQVAMMPKKMVAGQQLVQSNGKWYSLVAQGGGNFKLVAQGGGN